MEINNENIITFKDFKFEGTPLSKLHVSCYDGESINWENVSRELELMYKNLGNVDWRLLTKHKHKKLLKKNRKKR